MQFHLSFSLFSEMLWSYSENLCLSLYIGVFSPGSFKVSGCTLRSLLYVELIFLWKMNARNILPVFHMWISVSFHLLGRLLFVWGTFLYHLCWESCSCICICVGSFLVPLGNWIGLYVCFVPVLCFFVMNILSYNLNLDIVVPLAVLVFSLGCLWLFGVIWTFTWVFEFFSISMKKLNAIGILMESVLNL